MSYFVNLYTLVAIDISRTITGTPLATNVLGRYEVTVNEGDTFYYWNHTNRNENTDWHRQLTMWGSWINGGLHTDINSYDSIKPTSNCYLIIDDYTSPPYTFITLTGAENSISFDVAILGNPTISIMNESTFGINGVDGSYFSFPSGIDIIIKDTGDRQIFVTNQAGVLLTTSQVIGNLFITRVTDTNNYFHAYTDPSLIPTTTSTLAPSTTSTLSPSTTSTTEGSVFDTTQNGGSENTSTTTSTTINEGPSPWIFYTPQLNDICLNIEDNINYIWDGTMWTTLPPIQLPLNLSVNLIVDTDYIQRNSVDLQTEISNLQLFLAQFLQQMKTGTNVKFYNSQVVEIIHINRQYIKSVQVFVTDSSLIPNELNNGIEVKKDKDILPSFKNKLDIVKYTPVMIYWDVDNIKITTGII